MKIKNISGTLTTYGFACGYIERKENNGVQVTLWREPATNVYSVRKHNFNTGKRIFWKSFSGLTNARKLYNKTKAN